MAQWFAQLPHSTKVLDSTGFPQVFWFPPHQEHVLGLLSLPCAAKKKSRTYPTLDIDTIFVVVNVCEDVKISTILYDFNTNKRKMHLSNVMLLYLT